MNEETTEAGRTMDLARIMRALPHRYPFLMIDAVRDIELGKSAVGIKNVTINEPHFVGHFPNEPIMPGVLIVEAMAQTSAVLVVETLGKMDEDHVVYFMTLDKGRFRKKVVPGDVLELHVSVVRGRGKVWKFWGEGKVDGEIVAEAEYSAMIIDENDRRRQGGGQGGGQGGASHGGASHGGASHGGASHGGSHGDGGHGGGG